MSEIEICPCPQFSLWYVDEDEPPPIRVCTCGHPDSEHLLRKRSCLGEVLISRGTATSGGGVHKGS